MPAADMCDELCVVRVLSSNASVEQMFSDPPLNT